jgi:hypothetical protein
MERLKLTKIQNLLSNEVIKFILQKEKVLFTVRITYVNRHIYFTRSLNKEENKKINLITYYLIRNLAFNVRIDFTDITCQYIVFYNEEWDIEVKTQSFLFY